jgi:hypothetical protein
MKFLIHIALLFAILQSIYSQDLNNETYAFSQLKLGSESIFKSQLDSFTINVLKEISFDTKKTHFPIYDITEINYTFDTKTLNKRLFSNLKIVITTYKDYSDFFRLCSPLDEGVANNVNSADRMVSMVLNNFINNVVFKDRGPLTRLFSSKN